ncbi:DUF222 domain-containing protein [Pimelobacter simplex]|uniref:HNH endonuclease signature motif containing protein n=1 Tax=Nocardioides simplex TaxID=2045 RepID=UPI003AADE0F8
MSVDAVATLHPVLACARTVRRALAEVADTQPAYMSTLEKQTALVELAKAEAQVTELRLRVLAASGEVGDQSGARNAAAWLSHETRAEPAAARSDWHLATSLEDRPLLATALRAGQVSPAQARVIADGVADLPERLGADVRTSAEKTLVGYAAHYRPGELRRLARRILDVVAPEVAEAEDGRRLEDEERRARETASLRFHPLGRGRTRLVGILPTSVTDRLRTYLDAFTSPRQAEGAVHGEADLIPPYRKRAHAFAALLEHLDPARLPDHGGDATTLVVTLGLDQLRSELAAAGVQTSDGDTTISADQARRLACTARIIPAVLGTAGEVLDLGRASRLFRPAQRRALRLRDRTCRAEGCTIPAAWCETHHLTPWSRGGRTDLADGILLCSYHHHRIHDRAFDHDRLPNGDVRFHRRT